MHLSGQTPLFRAKNLEKYLGIESIYLKLEGANPTGHKNDRIAQLIIHEIVNVDFVEVDEFSDKYNFRSDKGFGSSGR